MQITTKFNLGDKVWTVKGCKAVQMTITEITVSKESIQYRGDSGYTAYPESNCFVTKKALVNYLTDGNQEM